MSDLSLFDLTTWTDPRSWIANGARLQQQAETLDLQFRYGPEPHTFRSAVRFLANGDLRVFGELITETGAVRSYETIALTSLDSSQDIASFRSGPASGIEVLRIEASGAISAETIEFNAGADRERWGRMSRTGDDRYLIISNGDDEPEQLDIECRLLVFRVETQPTGATRQWGSLTDDSYTDRRRLNVSGEFWMEAWDPGASTWENAWFNACNIYLAARCNGGKVHVLDSSGNAFIEFFLDGQIVVRPPSTHSAMLALDSTASGGARRWSVRSDKGTGRLRFVNETDTGTPTVEIDTNGNLLGKRMLRLTAESSASASIELNSTATSGAKKWDVRSEHTDGSLCFVNLTDDGTPKVKVTTGGSVYADEFLGTKVTSGAPSDDAGEVGAHVIDTSNKRIWVKVSSSGENRWWYAALADPG